MTLGKVYEGALIERPYLRVANVQDGHLNLNDVTTIEVPKEVAHRVTLRAGDVLMTEGGDLDKLGRGRSGLVRLPTVCTRITFLRFVASGTSCYQHSWPT